MTLDRQTGISQKAESFRLARFEQVDEDADAFPGLRLEDGAEQTAEIERRKSAAGITGCGLD